MAIYNNSKNGPGDMDCPKKGGEKRKEERKERHHGGWKVIKADGLPGGSKRKKRR